MSDRDLAAEQDRFETLLEQCERLGRRRPRFREVRALAALYRRHSARLGRLRDADADPDAIAHLNALCVRAYRLLYSSKGARPSALLQRRTWTQSLPLALARTGRAQLAAWGLLLCGGFLGLALAADDPIALYAFLPVDMGYGSDVVDQLWSDPEARRDFLAREETGLAENSFFGSYLFANNTRVGLLCFATGILAGIPTALLQLYNGLMLGGFLAVFLQDPWPIEFVAWILPHAIPELTAITMCGAAGLLLGGAVAAPGRRSRRAALRAALEPALASFACSLPLFAIAAGVESFIRESALGTGPRLAVAAALALLLLRCVLWLRALARRPAPAAAGSWLAESHGASRASASDPGAPGSG